MNAVPPERRGASNYKQAEKTEAIEAKEPTESPCDTIHWTDRIGNAVVAVLCGLGWLLLVMSCLAFFGALGLPRHRDQGIETLLTHPDGTALIDTILFLLGVNLLSVMACLFGVYAWARKNPYGKVLAVASTIVFLVNTVWQFLPPETPKDQNTVTDAYPGTTARRIKQAHDRLAAAEKELMLAVLKDLNKQTDGRSPDRTPKTAQASTSPGGATHPMESQSAVTSAPPPHDSRFTLVTLPLGVSIEVPKNWRLFDADLNTTIEAAGEAATKLAGFEMRPGQKVNLFRVNSNPPTTYAGIAINASDSEMSPADVIAASDAEIAELGPPMRQVFEQLFAKQNWRLIRFDGVRREVVDGHPSLVIEYVRSGPRGPVVVQMTRLLLGEKEISLNLSYRQSEANLSKPVIDYMRSTFHVSPLSPAD